MRTLIYLLWFFFPGFSISYAGQPVLSGLEEMRYELTMGFIKIGEGVVSIENDSLPETKLIKAEVMTTGFIKLLYNAHYFYSAVMDSVTGLPEKADKILNEGKYHSENEILFDRKTRPDSCIVRSHLSGQKVLSREVYDILTGFYKYRMDNIGKKQTIGHAWSVHTYFSDRAWDLKITYEGEEDLRTLWGNTPCIKCNVSTMTGHFFDTTQGLTIWYSADDRYVPVKIKVNMKIGSFTGNLVSFKQ